MRLVHVKVQRHRWIYTEVGRSERVGVSVGLEALRNRLWRDRRGAALIEHALLISLVILPVLATGTAVVHWANCKWANYVPGL
jgi:Flp pilus assembly pilin Flp